jgi:transcriptional regulator with XRE-family HTH domain
MTNQKKLYKAFGKRIRALRTRRKLTQLKLANLTGCVRTSMSNIEAGRQRVFMDDIPIFAKALKVAPSELMRGVWASCRNGKAH